MTTRIWFWEENKGLKSHMDMEIPVIPRIGEIVDGIGDVYGTVKNVHYLYLDDKTVVNVFLE